MSNDEPTLDPRVGRLISPEEMDTAFAVPALSANRFFVQPTASGMRIAFGENAFGSENIYFRVAVTLSRQDSVELYKLLQHMLRPFEKEQAKRQQSAEAEENG